MSSAAQGLRTRRGGFSASVVPLAVLLIIALGVTCTVIWGQTTAGLEVLWEWALKFGLFFGVGYLALVFSSAVSGFVVLQGQAQKEQRLRDANFDQFMIRFAVDGSHSLDGSKLHKAVLEAAERVVPQLRHAKCGTEAKRLIDAHREELRGDWSIQELYNAGHTAYLQGLIPELRLKLNHVLYKMQPNPWRWLRSAALLPLWLLGLRWDKEEKTPVFDQEELNTDLFEWGRVMDLGLLGNTELMRCVARVASFLPLEEEKPKAPAALPAALPPASPPSAPESQSSPALPPSVPPPDLSPPEARTGQRLDIWGRYLNMLREQIEKSSWDKPRYTLGKAELLAVTYTKESPAYADFILDVRRWKRRLERFPRKVFEQIVEGELLVEHWPAWFTESASGVFLKEDMDLEDAELLRICTKAFVMGDYELQEDKPGEAEASDKTETSQKTGVREAKHPEEKCEDEANPGPALRVVAREQAPESQTQETVEELF